MISVYDRMVKLFADRGQGEQYNLIFGAILNLHTVEEVVSFVDDYKKYRPNWRYEISYALGFYTVETRILWHEAMGDRVGINILLNRSERELYTQFEYIDSKGKPVPQITNAERGNHQSK